MPLIPNSPQTLQHIYILIFQIWWSKPWPSHKFLHTCHNTSGERREKEQVQIHGSGPWLSLLSQHHRELSRSLLWAPAGACGEEKGHVWKVNWTSWSKKLNNSKAYKCHYLPPICNSDSRTRFSLSFKRTGQLSNRRGWVFLFSSSGFSNDVDSP